MEKKYFINTYGCQMNVHESEKIAGILASRGYTKADSEQEASIIVFNTCCIRENAENHAYGNIGALKKQKQGNKDLIIAVGGCMTQQNGKAEHLKGKFPFIDIIFGTHNLSEFGSLLDEKLAKKKTLIEVWECEKNEISEDVTPFRTSYPNAWVNIMYGCNNFCSYCIVPYVRGRERSRNSNKIYDEVKSLVEQGYKEITLLGQNVNSYGNDNENEISFPNLLEKLAQIEGKYRLRFMTSHPKDFTRELVEVVAKYKNICNYVHLPVQAGSDSVLARMNRKYTSKDYLQKVEMLRSIIPDCAISSDIMIGFPAESEQDFLDTMELVKKVRFTTSFTFVYSRRSGTKADLMPDQIPEEVQKDRIMRLVELQNALTRESAKPYLGKTIEVLCEDYDEKKELYQGRDEYGKMGYFKSDKNLIGEFVNIKINETAGVSLIGEIVD